MPCHKGTVPRMATPALLLPAAGCSREKTPAPAQPPVSADGPEGPAPVSDIVAVKLYLTPFRGRVIERHSPQFFYATGTTSNAQVVAISRGEQLSRTAHVTWTGMATYGGSSGPSSVEDMFVTGEADFTRSPLHIRADEYFVRQTR